VELRQLELFVATAEEGHFGRAADRSNIVQSGLSASIRSLERELGTRLFDRTTRRVELTESGRALLPEARRALAAAASAREAVAEVEGLERGTLSLGIMQSLVAVRLPALLARFHSLDPAIDLRLRQAGAAMLLQDVREGRLELAFASFPEAPAAGLVGHELLNETMTLACAADHPLAEKASISLADLRDQDFVDGHRDWGIRIASDRAFAAAGVERHVAFEINDLQTILDLVTAGLGVAILPRSLAPLRTPLRFVRLRGKPPRWNVTLVAPAHLELSAAGRAFFEMVVGENASPGQGHPASPPGGR
jgi:DNA-binding transcriptional LysR family regulator